MTSFVTHVNGNLTKKRKAAEWRVSPFPLSEPPGSGLWICAENGRDEVSSLPSSDSAWALASPAGLAPGAGSAREWVPIHPGVQACAGQGLQTCHQEAPTRQPVSASNKHAARKQAPWRLPAADVTVLAWASSRGCGRTFPHTNETQCPLHFCLGGWGFAG